MLLYEKNHSYTFVKNFISMIRLLILTLTFSFISIVSAQETMTVSKEELLQKVSEKNLQLKLSQQEVAEFTLIRLLRPTKYVIKKDLRNPSGKMH